MHDCVSDLNLPPINFSSLPLTPQQVLIFISYLHLSGKAPATMTTYTAAIGFVHKFNSLPDPTATFIVQKSLASINKRFGKSDSRLPITLLILSQLLESLEHTINNHYDRTLVGALFTTAFFGLFRVGELTTQRSGIISIYLDQVKRIDEKIHISITNFKNNDTNKPFVIILGRHKDNTICPFLHLSNFLDIRGTAPGPLFCFANLKPIPRTFFASRLKRALTYCNFNPSLYLSHSFRIGSASYLASIGFTDVQIKLMGRWKSDAFLRYIRDQKFLVSQESM